MSHGKNDRESLIKVEVARAVIFVFMLLAIAEVVAPFMKVDFHDPLLLMAFVSGVLGNIIKPKRATLIVVKEGDVQLAITKLRQSGREVESFLFPATPDDALILAKTEDPGKAGVLGKIKGLLKRST